jgi:hypothetical protein
MRVLNRDRDEIRRLSMGHSDLSSWQSSKSFTVRPRLQSHRACIARIRRGSASKLQSGRKAIGQTTYLRIWPTNTKWHPWTKTVRLARVHTHSRPIFLSPAARSDDARWGDLGSAKENDARGKERERERERERGREKAKETTRTTRFGRVYFSFRLTEARWKRYRSCDVNQFEVRVSGLVANRWDKQASIYAWRRNRGICIIEVSISGIRCLLR